MSTPSILVIFGITGDLAQRKLLPALYYLFKEGLLDPQIVIIGVTRRSVGTEEIITEIESSLGGSDTSYDPAALASLRSAILIHQMSLVKPKEYQQLYELMNAIEDERGVCMNRLYYLSIPPQMFEPIVRNLGQNGLNASCTHGIAHTRLLVEKPFGYDLASAQELIAETAEWFSDEQMFRIDHYLAKDTVQNIIEFRKSAPQIEAIWNARHIDHIEITAYEQIDIEGRATFYEPIGALRDFIQSHLLQLAAVVAMEIPESSTSEAVHRARLELLESIAPIPEDDVAGRAVRAQYEGYRDEVQVPDSTTETYARVQLEINAERWQGVTVQLQTGKAMAEKRTDVHLRLRDSGALVVFHIQPDSGVSLEYSGQAPAVAEQLQPIIDSFNAAHPPHQTVHPDAYERVLLDAIVGDHTLFTTSQEVLAAWKVVDGVVAAWAKGDEGLVFYAKGSDKIT